jgi:hypothetical protein
MYQKHKSMQVYGTKWQRCFVQVPFQKGNLSLTEIY